MREGHVAVMAGNEVKHLDSERTCSNDFASTFSSEFWIAKRR